MASNQPSNFLYKPPLPPTSPKFSSLLITQQANNQPSINQLNNHLQINQPNNPTFKMETIKNAANYVSESVQQAGATASKETNKQVAKDNDASLSSRATAAKDAVGDKFNEESHSAKADVHKESAKH
ncbi:glucose-repressible gene protein [Colletotrichum sojae]|uniref:Glucose-repressible gene protein n=1 Tax=Colletotrichum sojae TaxID=2175907 RepID=A0A8H6J2I0_9PEZI|nr:glucose-repressible gene protein [Colletotrichum sojae]